MYSRNDGGYGQIESETVEWEWRTRQSFRSHHRRNDPRMPGPYTHATNIRLEIAEYPIQGGPG